MVDRWVAAKPLPPYDFYPVDVQLRVSATEMRTPTASDWLQKLPESGRSMLEAQINYPEFSSVWTALTSTFCFHGLMAGNGCW